MSVKVKEIKEDAIISIQVNRHFYLMVKSLSHYLVSQMGIEDPQKLKDMMGKKFEELSDTEKGFYTTALLLAEIETQANSQGMLVENEIDVENLKADLKKTEESNED